MEFSEEVVTKLPEIQLGEHSKQERYIGYLLMNGKRHKDGLCLFVKTLYQKKGQPWQFSPKKSYRVPIKLCREAVKAIDKVEITLEET